MHSPTNCEGGYQLERWKYGLHQWVRRSGSYQVVPDCSVQYDGLNWLHDWNHDWNYDVHEVCGGLQSTCAHTHLEGHNPDGFHGHGRVQHPDLHHVHRWDGNVHVLGDVQKNQRSSLDDYSWFHL